MSPDRPAGGSLTMPTPEEPSPTPSTPVPKVPRLTEEQHRMLDERTQRVFLERIQGKRPKPR